MLSENDDCNENLKRIADTLRISVDDFHRDSEYSKKRNQTDRMLALWEKLSTNRLREDALDAVLRVIQYKT